MLFKETSFDESAPNSLKQELCSKSLFLSNQSYSFFNMFLFIFWGIIVIKFAISTPSVFNAPSPKLTLPFNSFIKIEHDEIENKKTGINHSLLKGCISNKL